MYILYGVCIVHVLVVTYIHNCTRSIKITFCKIYLCCHLGVFITQLLARLKNLSFTPIFVCVRSVWSDPTLTTDCDATIRCTLLHSQKIKNRGSLILLHLFHQQSTYIRPSMQLWREDHYSKLLYNLVWSHLRFLTFLKDVSASQMVTKRYLEKCYGRSFIVVGKGTFNRSGPQFLCATKPSSSILGTTYGWSQDKKERARWRCSGSVSTAPTSIRIWMNAPASANRQR